MALVAVGLAASFLDCAPSFGLPGRSWKALECSWGGHLVGACSYVRRVFH